MKDRRDDRHQFVKAKKFGGGKGKADHSDRNYGKCDCGRNITQQEDELNDGLCNVCFKQHGG